MELQEMKELWRSTPTGHIPAAALRQMTLEKSQPLLKRIKLQLIIEMILWSTIIGFYHNAFDGEKRPVAINLVFVTGFLQAIAYNTSAYLAARNLIAGVDLSKSLAGYIRKLKRFKWTAICSRGALILAILVFFSYGLEMNAKRLSVVAGALVVFGIQSVLIWKSWDKRIDALSAVAEDLDNGR